ncbi:hypothetical protein BDY19DRAFT_880193 [Irpex rosettiformis]|uniref:Uncharacterized protein n=1 Tax=Irpex rosettiformis TaxID=378272 RepID=A0ACB8UL93_9APHY|nr:hypothetical protein BDY19DRAFT_880193 [Irpex rosettiformis]
MSFAPKPGCPMCSIVASAVHTPSHSPRSPTFPAGSKAPEILWRDDNFTIYRERANPVSSKGHLIVAFNLHVPSLYTLSSSDLPLLVTLRDLSRRLLSSLLPSLAEDNSPSSPSTSSPRFNRQSISSLPSLANDKFRIGFITPPFRDSKIPVTDHLHAHAYILPADLMGWWRAVGYGNLAWYDIDDLIAEIREETSNNRVRSGPMPRHAPRPIDQVPTAGARQGLPNGIETTEQGIAVPDLEDPERSPGVRLLDGRDSSSTIRPSHLSIDASSPTAPYTGAGGALLFSATSPASDGRRTPVSSNRLLSPNQIPPMDF